MNSKMRQLTTIFIFSLLGLFLLPITAVFAEQVPQERYVAGKSFVYRNGVWIDTAYEPAKHPLYRIGIESDAYSLLERSLSATRQYQRLGDHVLVVHEGWGIELINGRESGPVVATETRRPDFLAYQPPAYNNSPVLISGNTTNTPTLIAQGSNPEGITINLHLSWGEVIALVSVIFVLMAALWYLKNNHQTAEA